MKPAWLRKFELDRLFPRATRQRRAHRRSWYLEALSDRAMLNAAPVLGVNTGVKMTSLTEPTVITAAQLSATDADDPASELTYRVTALPTAGVLKLNGSPVLLNSTFTQQDVNDGKLVYLPAFAAIPDTFRFALTDGNAKSPVSAVSINGSNVMGNSFSFQSSISDDGRYVVFSSYASNLVANDTNGSADIFLRDMVQGTMKRISVGPGNLEANGQSFSPSISGDGKFVAYESYASNLVTGDTNNSTDIFVYNVATGATTRESLSYTGQELNGSSMSASLSADGRYVVFLSAAGNIYGTHPSGQPDVFVRDRSLGVTSIASFGMLSTFLNAQAMYPSISSNGRYVAFATTATNVVPNDTNGVQDVFVYDRSLFTFTRVSAVNGGGQANGASESPKISGDGSFIIYRSSATNLVSGDTNGVADIYMTNRAGTKTIRMSVNSAFQQSTVEYDEPSISDNALFATFHGDDSALVPGDTNGKTDVFLRELLSLNTSTTRVSLDKNGGAADGDSFRSMISGDGRYVVFESFASDMAAVADGGNSDIFIYDTGFIQSKVSISVNTAPVLTTPKTVIVGLVEENAGAPVKGTIGVPINLFMKASGADANFSDADAGTKPGIAIIATDRPGYYSLDLGNTWVSMGTVSPSSSLLLRADPYTMVYFKPNAGEKSVTGIRACTFRAWDGASGTNAGRANTTVNGGLTPFSSTYDKGMLLVEPLNHRPVLDDKRTYFLNDIEQYNDPPRGAVGTLVSQLVDFKTPAGQRDNVTDTDANAKLGIAVTEVSQGTVLKVYYSLNNGATWQLLGTPSIKSARLLAADASTRIYVESTAPNYVSDTAAAIRIAAWDQTENSNGGLQDLTDPNRNSTSVEIADVRIKIKAAVESAPVLDTSKTPTLNSVVRGAGQPVGAVGTLVSALIDHVNTPGGLDNVSDPNGHAVARMVITGVNTMKGAGYYSTDNGKTWKDLGSPSLTSARILYADANTRLYFRPKAGILGLLSDAFTFKACDTQNVANGFVANVTQTGVGGKSTFSAATDTIAINIT